jgi:hypothetical protein
MSPAHVRALATRIVQQLRRDHRTLALLFVAPIIILALLGYLLRKNRARWWWALATRTSRSPRLT